MRKYRRFIDPVTEKILDAKIHSKSRRTLRRAIQIAFRAGGFRYLFERFAECNPGLSYRDIAKMLGLSVGEVYRLLKFQRRIDAGTLSMLIFSACIDRRRLGLSLTKDNHHKMRSACFTRAIEVTMRLFHLIPPGCKTEVVVLEDDAALLLSALELLPIEFLAEEKFDRRLRNQKLMDRIVTRAIRYTPCAAGKPEVAFDADAAGYLQRLMSQYGKAALVAYVALQGMWGVRP